MSMALIVESDGWVVGREGLNMLTTTVWKTEVPPNPLLRHQPKPWVQADEGPASCRR